MIPNTCSSASRLIEQKLNWRSAEEWRNYEFMELSEKILDATSVNLSATTLKRIFGKLKYESLPSSATLNALAAFLGYASWMDFKSKQPLNKQVVEKKATTGKRISFATQGLADDRSRCQSLFVILAFTFLSGRSVQPLKNEKEIVFTSKPLANGLPNSVVFNVDLKGNDQTK
jgi:hypothetical protein